MLRTVSPQALRRLTYFAAIAEAGSIRGAAERLGLSVAVVSAALSELEAELSVSLAHRTTRRFALTEAGRRVQAAALEILRIADTVFAAGRLDCPLSGRLAVTLPVELASDWLAERLRGFRARHPQLELAVEATDKVVDLGSRMVEVAVRTAYLAPDAVSPGRETLPLICVARRQACLRRDGAQRLRLDMPLLNRRADNWLEARHRDSGVRVELHAAETLVVDNRVASIAMARAGLGAALVLERSVRVDLAAGTLVPVAVDLDFGAIAVDYLFRDPLPAPAAQAFVAFFRAFDAPSTPSA